MTLFRLVFILTFALNTLTYASTLDTHTIKSQLAALEKSSQVTIGVYAIDTNSHHNIAYHANELFPFQSTFKVIGAATLLKKSDSNQQLLNKTVHYSKKELVFWHPVTGQHAKEGMTLSALARAAVSYSDDPAINFIMDNIGGPKAVTAFAHSIGNASFNLIHYEPHLNSNPSKKADTVKPKDMSISLKKLLLGKVLPPSARKTLLTWMRDSTTGYRRIRAGVPIGWSVADKTGSGRYGIANDIGMAWSPACKPIILTIFTVGKTPETKQQNQVLAKTTKIIFNAYSKIDQCFAATRLG